LHDLPDGCPDVAEIPSGVATHSTGAGITAP